MNCYQASEELRRILAGTVKVLEPMKNHTTWRIGGPAEIFVRPAGLKDLQKVLAYAREKGLDITVIGNGSNLLVSDKGIRGIVVQIGRGMDHIKVNHNLITAGAGVKLARLAAIAREHELGGLEFAAGIPGTVGGALVMNAGANGSCTADLVREVVTVDYHGNMKSFPAEKLDFGYRRSCLRGIPVIVVEAAFEGFKSKRELIDKITQDYLAKRKKSQPLNYPSAGSVFKNPPGDSAGRLIEMAGGKGLRVGDAQVSHKHANFFINRGGATAEDMLTLIEIVRSLVFEKYGIELSLEVQLVGEL